MTNKSASSKSLALRLNLFLLRLSRNWLRVVITFLAIYVTLPFVAPTLMRLGLTTPGQILYTLYSPFCHQFAFRSFFLYGEQPAYPRSIVETSLKPFESYIADKPEFAPNRVMGTFGPVGDIYAFSPGFQWAAREYVGNPQMGYKTTLCERDIAIYSCIFIGALVFTRIRHRLRPVPLLLYALLGLGPIAIDGLSQLLGYPPFNFWPPRETQPIFRVVTGALFGFMNAWLGLPYLEISMRDMRLEIEEKLRHAGIQA
jgi:uncharacterized membrane protein